jgi:hypothetical protein
MVTDSSPAWFETVVRIAPTLIICILVFAILWIFRTEIKAMLGRLSKASAGPVAFELEQQQQSASELVTLPEGAASAADGQFPPDEPKPGTAPVKDIVPETGTLFKKPIPQDRHAQLARFWTTVTVFERNYRIIYGTQLRLLQTANNKSLSEVETRKFFAESQRLGNVSQSYENFMATLKAGFVSESNGQFSIAPLGRQFLLFLSLEGYSPDRPW